MSKSYSKKFIEDICRVDGDIVNTIATAMKNENVSFKHCMDVYDLSYLSVRLIIEREQSLNIKRMSIKEIVLNSYKKLDVTVTIFLIWNVLNAIVTLFFDFILYNPEATITTFLTSMFNFNLIMLLFLVLFTGLLSLRTKHMITTHINEKVESCCEAMLYGMYGLKLLNENNEDVLKYIEDRSKERLKDELEYIRNILLEEVK